MNQHDAQLKYGRLKNKLKETEKCFFVGIPNLIERAKLKRELEQFVFEVEQLWGLELFEPCPFCGSYDLKILNWVECNHWVECNQCGTEGPNCKTDSESIAAWNTRVD